MQRSVRAPIARQILDSRWICRRCAAKQIRQASTAAFASTASTSPSRPSRRLWRGQSLKSEEGVPTGPTVQQRRWIGRNYIKNIISAEQDWQQRAGEIAIGDRKSILDILEERGFVNQIVGSRESLKKLLDNRRTGIYCGVDPTAPSMHVGHMVPFMALSWMYIHGYPTTFLLGGATSRIGDPEGRLTAREDTDRTKRSANMALMHGQLKRFGALMERYAGRKGYQREWSWRRALTNNAEWHSALSWGDMMRDMGKYVRLGPMLGRDSVKNRMEHGDGMSFAEFSYPLVQAWDWWVLFKKGTQVQIGGADQFGNILQGADAVKATARHNHEWLQQVETELKSSQERKKVEVSEEPMGFTVPLLTTASGEKFGKSAGNAVWLDAGMTSVFELYAFWLKTPDADVEKYLKLFTFLPLEEIGTVMAEHNKDESKRVAQHKLAVEFTELVHGQHAAEQAKIQHQALFKKNMSLEEVIELAKQQSAPQESHIDGHPSVTKNAKPQSLEKYSTAQAELPRSVIIGKPLSQVLWSAGLAATKSEAQKLINNKGAYIGGKSAAEGPMADSLTYSPIRSSAWDWWKDLIIDDNLLILRTGKWRVKIIKIVPDADFTAKGMTCPGFGETTPLPEEDATTQSERSDAHRHGSYRVRPQPDIEAESDLFGSGGWDSITPLWTNKKTQKLMDRANAARRHSHDQTAEGLPHRWTTGGKSRESQPTIWRPTDV